LGLWVRAFSKIERRRRTAGSAVVSFNMNALEFIKGFDHLPMVEKQNKAIKISNKEKKRLLENSAVLLNGKRPKPNDEIEFPVWQLIFFPKSDTKRCTFQDIPQTL
jgi:hypothetical protein